jgi:hypothetical protein
LRGDFLLVGWVYDILRMKSEVEMIDEPREVLFRRGLKEIVQKGMILVKEDILGTSILLYCECWIEITVSNAHGFE